MSEGTPPAVLTRIEGPVGQVTLNRPEAMNAITVALAEELEVSLRELGEEVAVIVVRGAGGNFCVGGDVPELDRLRADGREAAATLFQAFRRALAAIAAVPVPVIAAVEGHAVAGGFELIQAADIAIVRDDARLADGHARFGQVPGGGSTQRLPRLIGRSRAMGLILTGDRISGRQAADWGLVYRSVPAEEFEATVADVAARLAGGSAAALAASKRLIDAAGRLPLEDGLDAELQEVLDHVTGPAGDAASAAFSSRRERS